nr:MAG TPA: hypothetical protein [Caudoviricetes sp.]
MFHLSIRHNLLQMVDRGCSLMFLLLCRSYNRH